MCRRVTCSECEKPTYAGCGMHIEQVLGDVPVKERCQGGHTKDTSSKGGFLQSVIDRLRGAPNSD